MELETHSLAFQARVCLVILNNQPKEAYYNSETAQLTGELPRSFKIEPTRVYGEAT